MAKEMKTTDKQRAASQRYREKNRSKVNYNNRRRDANNFLKIGTIEDLTELQEKLTKRLEELKENAKSDI